MERKVKCQELKLERGPRPVPKDCVSQLGARTLRRFKCGPVTWLLCSFKQST